VDGTQLVGSVSIASHDIKQSGHSPLAVFPNPVNNYLNFRISSDRNPRTVRFSFCDVRGATITKFNANTYGTGSLKMDAIPEGLYILNYSDGNRTISRKITVSR
jgi:hypothetical protein